MCGTLFARRLCSTRRARGSSLPPLANVQVYQPISKIEEHLTSFLLQCEIRTHRMSTPSMSNATPKDGPALPLLLLNAACARREEAPRRRSMLPVASIMADFGLTRKADFGRLSKAVISCLFLQFRFHACLKQLFHVYFAIQTYPNWLRLDNKKELGNRCCMPEHYDLMRL